VFRGLCPLVALVALPGAACSLSVDFEGSHFACSDGLCPPGFECLADRCTPLDQPDAGGDSCDGPDEILDPTSGHCYVLDRIERTWADALAACAARGPRSHLVTVGSSAENMVISQLGDPSVSRFAWMGAADAHAEGDWRWLDGADFPPSPQPNVSAFRRWHAGEPNNGSFAGVEQDCAAIALQGPFRGDWDDSLCEGGLASICETE